MTPLVAVAVPMAAIVPILLSGRRPNLREAWSLAAALATAGAVWSMLSGTLAGEPAESVLFELAPGAAIAFRADAAGLLFAMLASGLWVVTTVYSIGYMRALEEGHQTRYYAAFALSVA